MGWDWLHGALFVVKVLAVVLAAGVGGWVGYWITPFLGGRKSRPVVILVFMAVFGLAMWLVLTNVGGGLGPGKGPGAGGSGTGSDGTAKPGPTGRGPGADTRPQPSEKLRIQMLGGERVHDQRFYVLDHEGPRSWSEMQEVLAARLQREPRPEVVEVVIYQDSVDKDNPAVQQLVNWVKENKLKVTLSFPPQDAP
jgi:hypothetical protein